jgi:hypothetical protein
MAPIGQKRPLRGQMKTAIGIGCLVIAGVQVWLAYRIFSTKKITDPDEQKAKLASLDRTSRIIQVTTLLVVGGYLLFVAMSR